MFDQYRLPTVSELGQKQSIAMAAALVGFAVTWALYVVAPPGGLAPPFGIVVSLVSGTFLAYGVFSYMSQRRRTES